MATVDDALKMFSGQTNEVNTLDMAVQKMVDGFEQLGSAIDSAAQKMSELAASFQSAPEAVKVAGENMKAPFDSVAKSIANTALLNKTAFDGLVEKPQAILLSLAIGVVWEVLGDDIIKLLEPALQIVASAAELVRNMLGALEPIMWLVQTAADAVSAGLSLIGEHMDILEPIILGIAAAFLISNAAAIAGAIAHGIAAAASFVLAAAEMLVAFPLIALIAIFYAVVAAVNKFAGTSVSATGIIFGAFAFAFAAIGNVVIGVINAIIQVLWVRFVEPFLDIIEFVMNVGIGGFDSFGDAVANLVGQVISWFLSLGKIVTKIIDALFGTSFTDGLSSLQDSVTAWGKNENALTIDRNAPMIEHRFDYGDAWDMGYQFGQGVDDTIGGLFDSSVQVGSAGLNDLDAYQFGNSLEGIYGNSEDTAANTASISKSMNASEESLKYMRDLAEQEAINRFTTAEISIDMSGMTNKVNSNMDLDGVVSYLENRLYETMETAAEGAYA